MIKVPVWMAAGAVCGLTAIASAETATEAQLRAQVDALEERLSQVENKGNENWLNERRAEEVKALIQEVLSDADTRASLMADGMTAGHDGKFFLASNDGKFRMDIGGQFQFRYIFNFENDDDDQNDDGFQARRTKLSVGGHITAGPKWNYKLVLAGERDDGTILVEDIEIGTKITDNMAVKFGKFKLPFLREELTSSSRLLAVERGPATEFFTLDRAEQLQLGLDMDMIKALFSISDGSDSEFTEIGADTVEIAATARVDVKLAGDWKQWDDTSAWSGEAFAAFLGAAVHFEAGDGRNGGDANYLAWTIDGSIETNGLGIMAALTGGHTDNDSGAGDRDMLGFMVQIGYMVIPDTLEPFIRWDYIDGDVDGQDEASFVTIGMNYYFKKHNAKFTADVLWWTCGEDPSGNPFGNSEVGSGLGFTDDTQTEDSILVRLQFQLLF